jgi:hypothetical protein
VPLVAAAVCPHPPLLIPEVAAGAAGETAALRAACDAALAALRASDPDGLLIIGTGTATAWHPRTASGTLAPWGVPLEVSLAGGTLSFAGGGRHGPPSLPLSLTVGAWLLASAALDASAALEVAADLPPAGCLALGRNEVAGWRARTALLVMGDGTACRSEQAPGYLDPRAEQFDATVAKALAAVDLPALAGLDPVLAGELLVAGRPAWQVLAGAATGSALRGEVLFDAAPYGVNYTVAVWS